MKQLHDYHAAKYIDVLCTPDELYADIKALGYDWDRLLDTRGFWVFKEQEKEYETRELSTLDLLNMRKGLYHPKWYGKLEK